MKRTDIVAGLKALKLHGMAAAFDDLTAHATPPAR